jgi:DNA-binding Xre family transcriptional regulator
LKEVLAEKKIGQSKLSRMADVSVNTIHDMVKNPFVDVRINTLDKLATALGVEIQELYERLPDTKQFPLT